MLSMSGAIFRFSWFISNSYSKSEIARSPFTIACAPFSLAKSTISVSKGSTSTFGRFCTSALMKATRSSALKSVFCLRTGWFTTATTTLSNTRDARLMMSRWPSVTGSYEPGQTAVPPLRSAATVDRDAGVPVGPLVDERKRQGQRRALVGFGHGERALGEERRKQLGEPFPHLGGGTIWRVRENEVEGRLRVGPPEIGERVADPDHRVGIADRAEVRA